jgi:1-acyl-sn-glycerol-3-phosphate acyltransferase
MLGWRLIGEVPDAKQFLFVAVPHTSNWDFIYGWLAIHALDLRVKIFAKDSFFIFPINLICKMLGVLPVNRRKRTNFVDSVAQLFNDYEELQLLITPEGTRSYKSTLKSGYYYIAQKANIPIVVAGPNFKQKTFTIQAPRAPLASFAEDEAQVVEFAKTQYARIPENSF